MTALGTMTVAFRVVHHGQVDPLPARRAHDAPTAEQLALELADRVRWSAWNTKRRHAGFGAARWGWWP